jgi:chromosome partitioning protein
VAGEVDRRPEIVAFFSMVDGRKRLHRDVVATLPAAHPGGVVETAIPAATEVELMGVERAPVVVSAPHSRAARAYRSLWDEVRPRLGI